MDVMVNWQPLRWAVQVAAACSRVAKVTVAHVKGEIAVKVAVPPVVHQRGGRRRGWLRPTDDDAPSATGVVTRPAHLLALHNGHQHAAGDDERRNTPHCTPR